MVSRAWRLINDPRLFWITTILGIVTLIVTKHTIMVGIVESVIAAVWMGWAAKIRPWKGSRPIPLRVLAPMSVSVTPLMLASQQRQWEAFGLNVELDFSVTGASALNALAEDKCQVAVAGDYAICAFLAAASYRDYVVWPFAELRREVKLYARPDLDAGPALTAKSLGIDKIMYWPNSIHEEFLQKNGLLPKALGANGKCPNLAVIDFMAQTFLRKKDACVLVEPYFIPFINANYKLVPTTPVTWFMCIVMKRNGFSNYVESRTRIIDIIRKSCDEVNENKKHAVKACAQYALTEFTGIDHESLWNLVTKGNVEFGLPSGPRFLKRVEKDLRGSHDPQVQLGAKFLRESYERREK